LAWDTASGDINRDSFAPVSKRAYDALDNKVFLEHLATVDTTAGVVTEEVIKFHLVPDMRKQFNKFVGEYGCSATSRQITREEQDKINKSRKSLSHFTSVKVTSEAQKAYLQKNPAAAASTSASATSSSSAFTSKAAPLTDVSTQKHKRKLNKAAVKRASLNLTLKKAKKAKAQN